MSRVEATYAAFDDARTTFKPIVQGPCPTDLYEKLLWDMAGIHYIITEALANIYSKADSIPPKEQEKFAHFSLIGVQLIGHHHWAEETFFFPALEPEFTCPALEEHNTFSEALHNLENYLRDVCGFEKDEKGHNVRAQGKEKVTFDAAKIKHMVEELCGPMFVHLKAEIGYLDPEKVRSTGLPQEKIEKMNATLDNHLKNDIDPSTVLVHSCLHVPPSMSQFPPLPPLLRKVLVPWVFYWKHRKLWKYVPKFSKND